MASTERTRTNSPQSTSRTDWKADRGVADAARRLILAGGEVARFQDPARPYLHPEDVDIALDIDRYDFAVRVEFENGRTGWGVWKRPAQPAVTADGRDRTTSRWDNRDSGKLLILTDCPTNVQLRDSASRYKTHLCARPLHLSPDRDVP